MLGEPVRPLSEIWQGLRARVPTLPETDNPLELSAIDRNQAYTNLTQVLGLNNPVPARLEEILHSGRAFSEFVRASAAQLRGPIEPQGNTPPPGQYTSLTTGAKMTLS